MWNGIYRFKFREDNFGRAVVKTHGWTGGIGQLKLDSGVHPRCKLGTEARGTGSWNFIISEEKRVFDHGGKTEDHAVRCPGNELCAHHLPSRHFTLGDGRSRRFKRLRIVSEAQTDHAPFMP